MSALTAAILELAEALATEEVPAFPYVPEAVEPPCLILQPGEPYLDGTETAGVTFAGEYVMTLELFLVVPLGANEQAAGDLDQLLEHVLGALPKDVWALERIEQPGPIHTSEWLAHAEKLIVSRFITL